jgi:hypothetical protein
MILHQPVDGHVAQPFLAVLLGSPFSASPLRSQRLCVIFFLLFLSTFSLQLSTLERQTP